MKTLSTQSYLLFKKLPKRRNIGIFTLVLTFMCQLAIGQVHNITQSTNFSTIQAAIDDAATVSGDIIEVDAGTYTENVTVNKSLTIKGANFGTAGCGTRVAESIVAGGAGTAFTVSANDVTIDGFNITGATGISATGFGGMKFKNNLITAGGVGLNITNVSPSPLYITQINDNCITLSTQLVGANTTIGVFLNGFPSSPSPTFINNNTISGAFYGYLVHNFNSGLFGSISNGSITGCMQGVAVVNTLNGTNLFPSNIAIQGVSMSGFTGNHPTLPAQNFTAGIYTFTAGATTTSNGITLNINNVTINGTTSLSPSGAGIYLGDFSTGGPSVQTVTVTGSSILNNTNRGIDARGRVTVNVNTSTFTNNGNAAFGTDGNDGFTILAQRGATVTASNNTIVHPATSTTPVTAFSTGNTPANTITASNNSISMNGNANAKGANNSGGNMITATCNWWGVTGANVAPLMSGTVSFETFLSSGTDTDGASGFQPAAGTCNGCSSGNTITNTTSGKSFCTIQAAIDDATTNNGDVIVVGAGTYAENLTVSKSLDIRGPNYTISPIGGSRVAEAIIVPATSNPTTGVVVNVTSPNVKINGFTIDGDNTVLTASGVGSGGSMDAFRGIYSNINGIVGVQISNNIIKNQNGSGIRLESLTNYFASGPAAVFSYDNVIDNNLIENITSLGIDLRQSVYTKITNNKVSNARYGIYFSSFRVADQGSSSNRIISNNILEVTQYGIWANLYSATPYQVSNNTITSIADATKTKWFGITLSTVSGPQNFTNQVNLPKVSTPEFWSFTNNTINATGTDAATFSHGIWLWYLDNFRDDLNVDHFTTISGGSISNVNVGVYLHNVDTDAATNFGTARVGAHASISGTTISVKSGGTGIYLKDDPTWTTANIAPLVAKRDVKLNLGSDVSLSGGNSGIIVENSFANLSALNNTAFVGQTNNYIELISNTGDLNGKNSTFEGKTGNAMTAAERLALEAKLLHKPDNAALGLITFFDPVHNLTQDTYYATIQAAVTAANANDVIELSEGTYNERVVVSKPLTIQGVNKANCIVSGTGLSGTGSGFYINNGITNVTIKDLTIQNFVGNGPNGNAGVYAVGGNNNLTVKNTIIKDNVGGSGIYANGPINTVLFDGNTISGHTNVSGAARGIVIWNGLKENITITNNEVFNNNCCGIELQEGSATNVNISTNNVHDNGDSGMGLIGLTGPGTNTISNNTVTNNGRFGIEIKNPNGSGAASGAGSVVISGNTVTRTNPIGGEVRDIAGIAVFRRSVLSGNVDVPYGTVVSGNTVSGYTQPSNSDGFGIVMEGINHTVSGNIVSGNDVGIQRQAGYGNYPNDGDQSNLADTYFGRGNSPESCGIILSGNTLSSNTIDTRDVGNSSSLGVVVNTNSAKSFCTIQAAINDASTGTGNTITLSASTYNEQVLVNKELTIKSASSTKAILDFTGTPTGKPTIFDISANNVTIENINFKVDLSKLRSAVVASGAGIDNITVKDNLIEPYGAPAGSYGERNAVSVNYAAYRVATGGVNNVTFTGNTVTAGTYPTMFRSGISVDEVGGTFSGNTLATINHDILVRFGGNGNITVDNNIINGGGIELTEQNAGAGTLSITNNTFDATWANGLAPYSPLVRLKNNYTFRPTTVSGNTFTKHLWGLSLENYNTVTVDNNTFTPLANSTTYRHITIDTKELSSSSSGFYQPNVGATITKNTFNGSGAIGGTALSFANQDNDNPIFGAFVLGTAGNENNFNAGIQTYIKLENLTGTVSPNATTAVPWNQNLDAQFNFFDGQTGATASLAQNFAIEDKIQHKIDNNVLGFVTVKANNDFVTTNSGSIQQGVNAASAGFTVNVSPGTFTENVTVNKYVKIIGAGNATTVQGVGNTGNIFTYLATASGLDATNRATLEDLKLTNAQRGVFTGELANYFTVKNINFDALSLYGIHINNTAGVINDWSIENSTFNAITGPGIQAGTASGVDKFNISNSIFTNNTAGGIYAGQNGTGTGSLSNVTISNSTFTSNGNANNQAAIYLEKLSNATISDNTFTDNGIATNPRAMIINLKYKAYSGIEIKDNIMNETRGGVQTNGFGLQLAARNDAPSYNSLPASLNNVSIQRNKISNFRNGVGIENNVDWNTTTVQNNSIDNANTSLYGAGANTGLTLVVNNNSFTNSGTYSVANGVAGSAINADCNWFGSTAYNQITAKFTGNVTLNSWLINGTDDNLTTKGFQPVAGSCTGTPIVIASAVPTPITCTNTTASIALTFSGGTAPYDVTWTGGGSATGVSSPYTLTSLSAGTYTITVTDAIGSIVTTTATVTYYPVTNITANTNHLTIQAAVTDASNGDIINVCSGTYNEQVIVNKSVKIIGVGTTKPIINFTGTVTGKPTLIDISAKGVTVENFNLKVDLTKLSSGIIASGADLDNTVIKNNLIEAVGSTGAASFGSYGDRNAVSINYGGTTNYRTAVGGVDLFSFQNNTVTGVVNDGFGTARFFRSGISADEIGGLFSGNTLQSINHDILVRFAGNGDVTVSDNNFNGGGLELAEFNAGAGNTSVSNNAFNATFANTSAPGTAVLRLKNNQQNKVFSITGNNFTNHQWAASLENFKNVTLGNNTFTPLANSTTYQHIVINTKSLSSNSNAIVQTAIGATLTSNTFNGSGTLGGTALNFLNHDSDNATFGTFSIGTSGNENTFNTGIAKFIALDTQTGSTNTSTFPTYPTTGGWPTTMACWSTNLDIKNNLFDVGAGAALPSAMTFGQRNTLETLLQHKPDVSCAGKLEYYLPVKNLTQNTFFADIQPAIVAAAANDVIELSEWTFAEGITIDKPLTIQGVDSANVVLNGASIADANGITLANGVQNIIIKKLKIKNFKGSSTLGSGIFGIQNSNLMIDEVVLDNNQGRGGVYLGAGGGIQNVTIKNSISKNHGVAGSRGIVIWDGYKQNITIQNNKVYGNNCCGIELQDGTASGVTISGNFVVANVDNGFGLTGLKGGIGANIIENNIIMNNGRFGIEIKNPNGNGLETGDGSIVVRNNTVSLAASPTMNNRDHAGIAVFRRGFLVNNTENYVNIPTGVVVKDNNVSGYKQLNVTSTESKGYGIVVEGTNHKVMGNTVDNNDVGIQEQGGGHNAPNYVDSNSGDGDQTDGQSPNYFGRGNTPVACSNTISSNTLTNNAVNNNTVTGANSFAMVVNTTTRETFCSIQAAINDPQTLNGHTLEVSSGTFNEQVLVNKEVIIKGIGSPKPIVNFTGTPALASGKLTAFEVTVPNVTVDNLEFKVDISKIGSAIVASVALPGSVSNLKIQNNDINPYRSSNVTTIAFGSRNAVNINYGAFRVDASKPIGILGQNNTISYSNGVDNTAGNTDDAGFRAGFAMDEGTGDFTGNTIQTISQDIELRFTNTANNINITNNNINGGGINFAAPNVTGGTLTISGNIFNGTFGSTYSSLIRLRDNIAPNFINTVVQNNTFSNHTWGISLENYNNVTVNNNTFTPLANSINYHHITVNTKENASSSAIVAQTPIGGVFTNNTFNGSGTTGGTAIKFLNQDSDNASFGTITLGSASNENTFNAGIANFIALDSQTGSSNGSTFPVYPTTGDWPTTMACWNQNINIENNKFDVGAGLQLPSVMNFTSRTAFEAALTHKPDNACLGTLIYFYPVKNVTQNTTFLTIQPAIAAAAANDVIELSEWTFTEGITIDKALTIQGVDSANVVLNGASIADANGITLANGVQNITIKKLKIRNFKGSSALGSGIYGSGGNNNLMIDEIVLDNNQGRGGIYIAGGGGINNVTIKNSISKNNSVAGSRGIVIWDGFKQNITITGNKVYNNNCCGIELQDGTASGVTVTDNIVFGNVDNGLGLTGLMQGAGPNLIKNNMIINNGRFGIEIKLPNGTGATSGDGSIVVEDNTVQQTAAFNTLRPSEVRDIAGIAAFRRGYVASYNNVDIPKGVVIRNNTVSGYSQNNPSSSSTGFGIVIEGTDHTVTGNTLNNNNVGIQQQSGHLPYTANSATDGDQSNLADLYFGRGNSPLICNNVISSNTFNGNTVTDARNIRNGAVVTEDITPTVDAVSSQVVCNGSSSTLISFTGNTITGKTYNWTNTTPGIGLAASGSGDITAFTVTNATTVAVTATVTVTPVANGCSGTPITFTITVNPSPTITATSDAPQCVGTALNLTATGGTAYSWTGPNSFTASVATPSITNTTNANAGTYSVTVTDANGCTASATTTVTFHQLPTASIVSNSPICSGGNINITLTTDGASYAWAGPNSFTSTDQSPSITAATTANSGTYTVTVTSANGCTTTATTSVTVNPLPNATAGSNTPQCVGGTLNLTSSNGVSYAWTGPNSFTSSDQNPSIANVTNAANGTYSVTVTDVNGCSATATTTVVINPKPAKPTILPSSATVCEGGSVTLVVICPGNTVVWSNGASGSSIVVNPISTTSYTATCTNSFGCTSDPSDPATVNIVAKPAKPVVTPSTTTICAGSSATLTATACTNGTLTWSNGATTTSNTLSVSPTTNQSYTVTCTSLFGCISEASDAVDVIVNPIPTTPTVENVLISSGASASLTAICATGVPVWYASSTATTSLGVGNYISPALTVNTTYYIACETSPGGTSMTNPQNCVSSRVEQTVTIDVFAIVAHPADLYVCAGQNAFFTVGATGASITYQWQVNDGSGWNNLSNGGVYSGVNAATLNISQSPATLDGYQYRCVITNTKPDALAPLTLTSNPAVFVVKGAALANNLIIVSPLASIANLYQAVQTITATNKISGTSRVDYFAGNSITLNPGFEVSAGSVFKAKIQTPCINTSAPLPDTLKK